MFPVGARPRGAALPASLGFLVSLALAGVLAGACQRRADGATDPHPATLARLELLVTRGPYLQMGAPTEATIRWRTNLPARGRVTYGPLGAGGPMQIADTPVETSEPIVRLTGLTPDTRYDYTIGTDGVPGVLAGGDGQHFFVTPPLPGPARPTRIWVIGDSGTADASAAAVYGAYRAFNGDRHTDLWLMLGDNAYLWGTDEQYQQAVFDFYPELLRQVFLWPVIGNHETYYGGPPEQSPYLDIFSLPTAGEVGGLASGTELYYSFDHANIHFVALDSMVSSRAPGAAMWAWLDADLHATDKTWLIAYFHHPPYTKGNHDSDNAAGLDPELVDMRERALPILEAHGVDLVLCGHSHRYERSYFLQGHYGGSSTLDDLMKRDHGDGRRGGQGPYRKTASARGNSDGAVYVVAGSSGQVTPGIGDHPAMQITLSQLGSLVLDVDDRQLRASFLREDGTIEDDFSIEKNVPPATTVPSPPTDLRALPEAGPQVLLSWSHRGDEETGFLVERAGPGGGFSPAGRLGANAARFTDRAVALGDVHRYRVRASNEVGVSDPSNEVSIVVAEPPPEGADAGPPAEHRVPVRTRGGGGQGCAMGAPAPSTGATEAPSAGLILVVGLALLHTARRRGARGTRRTRAALLIVILASALGGARPGWAHGSGDERLEAVNAELRAHPTAADAYRRRGDLLLRLGRREEAAADLHRATALDPRLPGLDRLAARLALAAGRIEDAQAALDRALHAASDDVEALRLRAGIFKRRGDPTRAAADLERVVVTRGRAATPDDHLLLVRELRAAHQPGRAAEALARATAQLGPLVSLELEAIDLAESRGHWDEALARIDAFAARVTRPEMWLVRRGAVLTAAHRPAAARAAYTAALAAIARLPPHIQGTRAVLTLATTARTALGRLR